MFIEENKELYRPVFMYKSKNENKIIKDIIHDVYFCKISALSNSHSIMDEYAYKVLNWTDTKTSSEDVDEYTILLDTENKNGDHLLCYIFRFISYKDIPNEDNNFYPKSFYEFNYRGFRVCLKVEPNKDLKVVIYHNNYKTDILKCFNINSIVAWAIKAFEFIDQYILDKDA